MAKAKEKFDYVIVGNSAAGVNAGEAIRALDKSGSIAIFGEEDLPVYSRPMISYLVSGEASFQKMLYRPRSFYQRNGITFFRGVKVIRVDPAKAMVTASSGEVFRWGKLLLATGSLPFIPPIEGLEEVRYQTFVNYADAQGMIKATANRGRKVLIVGAGLIGMKAAEAAYARGAQVTVVEKMKRILPAALDGEVSRRVEELCNSRGLRIITGESVKEVVPAARGKIPFRGRAILEGGDGADFDILVIAVGVVPRVELARQAGLAVNRGVLVDEFLRSSQDDIYAAGDVAEAFDLVWEEPRVNALWPNAALQGRYAGWNMAGEDRVYPGSQGMNAVEFFGLPVLSAGIVNPPDENYEVIASRLEGGGYRKVVIKDGVLVGMIVAGEVERAGILNSLIQEKARVRRFKHSLVQESFSHIYLPRAVRQARIYEGQAGIFGLERRDERCVEKC